MRKQNALQLLQNHKETIRQRFGVRRYFGLQFYLEDLFGCPVDLVTDKALRPELRPHSEKEAIRVA